jgi:exopolyphosphatase/guanosine-5'-triphosphate,3'-diphosphate pyrophosphatase
MSVVLQLAALLHDIGEVVHRASHHKHSEYLILNGRIPGLDPPLRELVAAVARAHRKSTPAEKKHPTYQLLSPENQTAVRKLAALLRIADSLDTDHRQRIVALTTEIKPKKVTLHVSVGSDEGVTPVSGVRKAEAFEAEFDRKLICTVAGVSARPRVPFRSE